MVETYRSIDDRPLFKYTVKYLRGTLGMIFKMVLFPLKTITIFRLARRTVQPTVKIQLFTSRFSFANHILFGSHIIKVNKNDFIYSKPIIF